MFVNNIINFPPCCQAAKINCRLISTLSLFHFFQAIFNRAADLEGIVTQNIFVRLGLGREPQQAEKYTRSASAVRVIFRVCGYKGIACTGAFVYTQALLAPLQNQVESLLHALLLFLQNFVDPVRIPSDDGINDSPNQQITDHKNSSKHQDWRCTPIQPIVNQVSE